MSPTISNEAVRSVSSQKIPEIDSDFEEAEMSKDIELGAKERAKRRIKCDYDHDSLDYNKKRKQQHSGQALSSSSSSSLLEVSSLSSTSADDYGTDTELVEINNNTNNNIQFEISCGCDSISTYENIEARGSRSSYTLRTPASKLRSDGSAKIKSRRILSGITTRISNSKTDSKILLDIAVATIRLIQKNREFQVALTELQSDTANLLNSVLENPENFQIKERLKFSVL